MNVLIKISEGHKFDGEGEPLGDGVTFWRSSGHMEVPFDLALKLEKEKPKRFEMVDRKLASELLGELGVKVEPVQAVKADVKKKPEVIPIPSKQPVPKPKSVPDFNLDVPSYQWLKEKTKDFLNDWAAKRDYEANTKDNKNKMIKLLIEQIEKRTGKRVK